MSGGWFNVSENVSPALRPVPLPPQIIDDICDSLPMIPSVDHAAAELARYTIINKLRGMLYKVQAVPTTEKYKQIKEEIHRQYERTKVLDDQQIGMQAAEAASNGAYQFSMDAFGMAGLNQIMGAGLKHLQALFFTQLERNDPKVIVHFDPYYAPAPSHHYTKKDVVDMRAELVQMVVSDFISEDGIIIGPLDAFENDNVSDEIREQRRLAKVERAMEYVQPEWWNKFYQAASESDLASRDDIDSIADSVSIMRIYFDTTLMYAHRVTLNMIANAISLYGKIVASQLVIMRSSFSEGIIDIACGRSFQVLRDVPGYEAIRGSGRRLSEQLFFNDVLRPHFKNLKVKGVTGIREFNPVEVNILSCIKSTTKPKKYQLADAAYFYFRIANNLQVSHSKFRLSIQKLTLDPLPNVAIEISREDNYVLVYSPTSLPNATYIENPNTSFEEYIQRVNIDEMESVGLLPIMLQRDENDILVYSPEPIRDALGISYNDAINAELAYMYGRLDPDAAESEIKMTWAINLDISAIRVKGVPYRSFVEILKILDIEILFEGLDEMLPSNVGTIYVISEEDPLLRIESYVNSRYNVDSIFDIIEEQGVNRIQLKNEALPVISSASISAALSEAGLSEGEIEAGNAFDIRDRLSRASKIDIVRNIFEVDSVDGYETVVIRGTVDKIDTNTLIKLFTSIASKLAVKELLDEALSFQSAKYLPKQRIFGFLRLMMSVLDITDNKPNKNVSKLRELFEPAMFDRIFFVINEACIISIKPFRENISNTIIQGILSRAGLEINVEYDEDVYDKLRKAVKDPDAERFKIYTYAVAVLLHPSIAKKQLFKEKESVYRRLLRYPWIDRRRTLSNDWREIQRTLGVETSLNFYMYDLALMLDAFKVSGNLRHYTLITEFIYEYGYPIGLSRTGIPKHHIGAFSETIIGNPIKQLLSSIMREPESTANVAPATVIGLPVLPRHREEELLAEAEKRKQREERAKRTRREFEAEQENRGRRSALPYTINEDLNLPYYSDDVAILDFTYGEPILVTDGGLKLAVDVEVPTAVEAVKDIVEVEPIIAAIPKPNEGTPKLTLGSELIPGISPVDYGYWKALPKNTLSLPPVLAGLYQGLDEMKQKVESAKVAARNTERSILGSSQPSVFSGETCVKDDSEFLDVEESLRFLHEFGMDKL